MINFRKKIRRGFQIFLELILGGNFGFFLGVGFPQNWEAKNEVKKLKNQPGFSRVTREAFQHFGLEKSVAEIAPRRSQKIKMLERFSNENLEFCKSIRRFFFAKFPTYFLERFSNPIVLVFLNCFSFENKHKIIFKIALKSIPKINPKSIRNIICFFPKATFQH